jgi:hypothetical protein
VLEKSNKHPEKLIKNPIKSTKPTENQINTYKTGKIVEKILEGFLRIFEFF